MNFKHAAIALSFLLLCGCQQKDDSAFIISTTYGDMKITLYDDTPNHKKRFNKLVKEDVYNEVLFHSVQQEGVAEGGNPASRDVRPNRIIGENPIRETISAEISATRFHKRGAIGMRNGASSEFYIVLGKKTTIEDITQLERESFFKKGSAAIEKLFIQHQDSLSKLENSGDSIALLKFQEELIAQAKNEISAKETWHYSDEQIHAYREDGGLPALDGEDTVFGEVTEGFDVLEKIEHAATYPDGRPKENIVFCIRKE